MWLKDNFVIIFIILLLAGCSMASEKKVSEEADISKKEETAVWTWNDTSKFNGIPGEVLTEDDRVFFGGDNKYFYAIDKNSGQLIWDFDSRTVTPYKPLRFKEMMIVGAYGGGIFGVDHDGNQIWKFRPEEATTSQPFIFKNKLYVVEPPNKIHILNPETGESLNTLSGYANKNDYVLNGNIIYSTDWSEDTVTALNLETGTNLWVTNTGEDSFVGRIHLVDDTLYVLGQDENNANLLTAINTHDGEVLWKENLKGDLGIYPVFTEDSLYYSVDGSLYQFNFDEKREVWSKETNADSLVFRYEPHNKLLFLKSKEKQIVALDHPTKETKWTYNSTSSFSNFQVDSGIIFLTSKSSLSMVKSPFTYASYASNTKEHEAENESDKTVNKESKEELAQSADKESFSIKVAVNSQKGELGSNDSFGYLLLKSITDELGFTLEPVLSNGIVEKEKSSLREGTVDIIIDHIPEGEDIIYSENYGERFETSFGFRETDQQLFQSISGKMEEFKQNGRFQALFTEYYGGNFVRIGVMDVTDNVNGSSSVGAAILSEILSKNNYQYELEEVPTYEGYSMLLRLNAVDILVAMDQFYDKSKFNFLLTEPYAKELYVSEHAAYYSFAVNEENEHLLTMLNTGLQEMQASGHLNEILEQYGWVE